MITRVFQTFLTGALRKAIKVRSALTQHSLVERMTERTLSFPDRTLNFILAHPAENDLLTLVGKLGSRHVAEILLFLLGRKTTFHLRQPVSISGKGRRNEKHESTDFQQGTDVGEIQGHHEGH